MRLPIEKRAIWEAYLHVRGNKGSHGVDNEDRSAFDGKRNRNLYKLWNWMNSGSYFAKPLGRVMIPNAGGLERPQCTWRIGEVQKPHRFIQLCKWTWILSAKYILEQLKNRFAECGLEIHPERIKLMQTETRKEKELKPEYGTGLDFPGHRFRKGLVKGKDGSIKLLYRVHVSPKARKKMLSHLHTLSDSSSHRKLTGIHCHCTE